ncbi:hypothetical protein BvCmsSIP079_04903 [Escherichia coli]|nr:hypothetical protein BvCmsSIP079_04903 [Escherichia coli]SQM53314.1 Uncharacterised protein [Escherichia coli]VAY02001.1 Uncharacterised protein [Escherichia coli]
MTLKIGREFNGKANNNFNFIYLKGHVIGLSY